MSFILKAFLCVGLCFQASSSFGSGLASFENTYELQSSSSGEWEAKGAFITLKVVGARKVTVFYSGGWAVDTRGLTREANCSYKKKGQKYQCDLESGTGFELRKDKNIYQYTRYSNPQSIHYSDTRYYLPKKGAQLSSAWNFSSLNGSLLTAITTKKETSLAIYCDTAAPLLKLKFKVSNLLYRAALFASDSKDHSLFIKSSIDDNEFNFSEWEVSEDNVILRTSPVEFLEELSFKKGHKVSFDFLLKDENTGDLEPLTQLSFSLSGSSAAISKVTENCSSDLGTLN